MAAIRGKSRSFATSLFSHINPSSSSSSSSLLFFSRAFSSEIFVKGLSFSTTEVVLTCAFSDFGEVVQARIVRDKASNKSRGYGFVTFAADDAAEKALTVMNGKIIDGRVVFVDKEMPVKRRYDGKKVQKKAAVQRDSTSSSACISSTDTASATTPSA